MLPSLSPAVLLPPLAVSALREARKRRPMNDPPPLAEAALATAEPQQLPSLLQEATSTGGLSPSSAVEAVGGAPVMESMLLQLWEAAVGRRQSSKVSAAEREDWCRYLRETTAGCLAENSTAAVVDLSLLSSKQRRILHRCQTCESNDMVALRVTTIPAAGQLSRADPCVLLEVAPGRGVVHLHIIDLCFSPVKSQRRTIARQSLPPLGILYKRRHPSSTPTSTPSTAVATATSASNPILPRAEVSRSVGYEELQEYLSQAAPDYHSASSSQAGQQRSKRSAADIQRHRQKRNVFAYPRRKSASGFNPAMPEQTTPFTNENRPLTYSAAVLFQS